MIRIVTDSTCDLPLAVVKKYGITVIPLYINAGGQGYLDGVDITRQEFYQRLPDFHPHPTTAAPGTQVFVQAYNHLAQQGADQVLSIHISLSLSATVDIARSAAQQTSSLSVTVLDGRQLSLGTGFQVELAARAAMEGRSLADILALVEDQIRRTYVFAALDTLEYLRRSGRMSSVLAHFAGAMQVKPLLRMHNGKPSAERVRTCERAAKRLLEILEQIGPLERAALVHTNAAQRAAELRQMAAHLLPQGELPSVDITPVIGANIGPGAAGFAVVTAS